MLWSFFWAIYIIKSEINDAVTSSETCKWDLRFQFGSFANGQIKPALSELCMWVRLKAAMNKKKKGLKTKEG